MAARRGRTEALPVFLRFVAIPLAGAFLFLLFLHLGFPYDRLAGRLADRLEQATHTQIQFGELTPRLSLLGPGLEATGVIATPAAGGPIRIDGAFLRPAWSFAWLRGRPALHFDLKGVELANLPLAAALPGVGLDGRADLRLDLVLAGEASEASVRFSARDGSLHVPGLGAPVPFTAFTGRLDYGGENRLELSDASLDGPVISLLASGSLGRGASIDSSPLKVDLEATAKPGMLTTLRAAGVELGADGRKKLQLTGTPARPEIR